MTAPNLDSFFSGSSGRSVSWKDKPLGSKVEGKILAVHPPQQQTDPVDGSLQFYKKGAKAGQPKMSVRIDLETPFRNWEMCAPPDDDPDATDDGVRGLYVQGWMQGAVGDALRKAGRQGPPEVGGYLTVTLTERQKNDNPALNPINKFEAEYRSPSAAATGDFFGGVDTPATSNGLSAPAAQHEPAPQKPPGIEQATWDGMPDAVKRQLASTMATAAGDKPPF